MKTYKDLKKEVIDSKKIKDVKIELVDKKNIFKILVNGIEFDSFNSKSEAKKSYNELLSLYSKENK